MKEQLIALFRDNQYFYDPEFIDKIIELFKSKMPNITDEEIEAQFTTPHYHYEKGHYYRVRKDRIFGAKWMRDCFLNCMKGTK